MADRMTELKEKGWAKLTKEERDEYRALKGGGEAEEQNKEEDTSNEGEEGVEGTTDENEDDTDENDTLDATADLSNGKEDEKEEPKKEVKKGKGNSTKPTKFTGVDKEVTTASAVFTKYTFAKNTKFQGQIYEMGQRLPDCSPEDVKMLLDANLITI